jgi:hypothetical protein
MMDPNSDAHPNSCWISPGAEQRSENQHGWMGNPPYMDIFMGKEVYLRNIFENIA